MAVSPGGAAYGKFFAGFQEAIAEINRVNDAEISLVFKNAEGDSQKLKELISEAVVMKPDIIATISSPPTAQALKETKETQIPILTALGDPVEHGYIKSLQSSGTNLAGIAQQNIELTPKRFEILKELVPAAKKWRFLRYHLRCDKKGAADRQCRRPRPRSGADGISPDEPDQRRNGRRTGGGKRKGL